MPTILSATTTDTVGSLVSHTGPCTVFVHGTPAGCTVALEASPTTNTTDVTPIDRSLIAQDIFVDQKGVVACDMQGTYYLRATISNASASTSIAVTSTQ